MTLPDPNTNITSSKYNVQIGQAHGPVIGDNVHVEQHFYGTPSEPLVDLTAAEAIYRQKVVDAYKWLNFSGFDIPDLSLANVPLEEVFVRLTLTMEKVIREPTPPEELSQAGLRESPQRKRVITVQEPIELVQALSNHLLIVGEPGAGKSTLLRWLAVTFAQGLQREPNRLGPFADADRLPVLVELGRLPDRYVKPEGGESPNWIQFLPEHLPAQLAFTDTPPQLLARLLADGRCLLLFDGLDEIADRQVRTRLARSLVELARLSPGNRVIIGSRPAGVSESEGTLRPQFQRCQIKRFISEDVQRFFRFWYELDRVLTPEQQRDSSDALYARVQATPATLELATTPLLSTILLLIWRNEGGLPERRVDLYERCCRVLIQRWEAYHDVAYQGALVGMDWEDHLRLLTPLAYAIHSQEQRTSATREELVPVFAQSLQVAGFAKEQDAATREAKHFLDALGLRSGLLQYMGDDRYGFPHQTFQEYLAARYIAARPDPEYIDLVMAHLHEAWWQEVHLLTIGHLGSGNLGASKVSALILTILQAYTPPSWILRSSRNPWLRIRPGKLLPQVQLDRRIAWILAREFELAAKGYTECMLDGTTAMVRTVHDAGSYVRWRAAESLGRVGVGNEAVVSALLAALHDAIQDVRKSAAESLGRVGVGNEAVVSALLAALHDADQDVRKSAAESLGQVGVGNEAVVSALLAGLHDADRDVRRRAAESLSQVGVCNEAVVSALLETALHDADSLAALHDADQDVRKSAAESLGQVGVGNEAVVSALLAGLHDADRDVQRRAVESLGRVGVGNEAVVSALLEVLHDADRDVRRRAAESLGQVGVGNEAVVSALLAVLHDAGPNVRRRAAESLGRVGVCNEAVVSALQEAALHDADRYVRWRAAESLGRLEIKDTIQLRQVLVVLTRCLYDWESDVLQATLISIRQLMDGRPIPGYRWVPLRK